MIKGVTTSGFNFTLDEDALDDYELLEAICSVDHGNYSDVTKMVHLLLGSEQESELKAFIKNRDGKIRTSSMMIEIKEIFNACNAGKNS